VLVRELDLAAMAEERLTWGIYRDRRPEMYGALLSLDGQPSGRASIMSALTKIAMGLALLLSVGVQAEEAQEEKVLRLYNWSDYFAPDTLSEFTRETGIRVIYDVMDSSETLEAKLMAGRSGYDLIFPGDTVAERLMRAGSLQPLDKGKLQHLGT
jgi:putrescine transport system substrate-binding protein